MWSAAYSLVALAVAAFALLYAAAHTPTLAPVNFADQLYGAKTWLAGYLPSLPRTDRASHFRLYVNVVRVKMVNVTAYDSSERQWVLFPIALPLGYRLEREGRNILYQLFLNVTACRRIAAPRGEPYVLYEIEVRHSLDPLPWLEVYAVVAENVAEYYNWLYGYYKAWGRPVAVGLDPYVRADGGFVVLMKAEHALVYNATSGTSTLYVTAPASALYILVVDYPLAAPLTCPYKNLGVGTQNDIPVIEPPNPPELVK